MSNSTPLVHGQFDGPLYRITLANPDRRNSLSTDMIGQVHHHLRAACNASDCRVIIINAQGNVFSAGHDLHETRRRDGESQDQWRQRLDDLLASCASMMQDIITAPKAVIAEISGTATAAGCQLVSVCDLAFAASEARFCTPGVNIGIFCTTPLVGIGRNISRKHAMEMALTGDMFSAQDAERFGLINAHFPAENLSDRVTEIAQKIAARSAQGIRAGKAAFYQQMDMPLAQAFDYASTEMRNTIMSGGDADEGVQAFIEKRAPNWGEA